MADVFPHAFPPCRCGHAANQHRPRENVNFSDARPWRCRECPCEYEPADTLKFPELNQTAPWLEYLGFVKIVNGRRELDEQPLALQGVKLPFTGRTWWSLTR